MDHLKCIESNQKEESISAYRVKPMHIVPGCWSDDSFGGEAAQADSILPADDTEPTEGLQLPLRDSSRSGSTLG